MGVIVNIAAYFLRKYISSELAKISGSYANYKNKRDAKIEEKIDLLCKNPELLIIFAIQTEEAGTLLMVIMLVLLLLCILLSIMKEYVSTDIPRLFTLLPLVFVILAQVSFISALKRKTIVRKACSKLRKQRKLETTSYETEERA